VNPAGEEAVRVDRTGDLISSGTNGSGELVARLRFEEVLGELSLCRIELECSAQDSSSVCQISRESPQPIRLNASLGWPWPE